MKYRKRAELGKLKKTSTGTYYNPKTKTEYKKTDNGYKMVTDKWLLKEMNNDIRRLQRINKKTGGVSAELEYAKYIKQDYLNSVKAFNKGEIKRPETITRRINLSESEVTTNAEYYSPENKAQYMKDIQEKNKATYSRYLGQHNVNNGKAYDKTIKDASSVLGLSIEETQELLFPSSYNELSKYNEYKKFKEQNTQSVTERVDSRIKSGEISRAEGKSLLKELGYV